MNTGQMLLVVGAFSLLSSTGLSVNRTFLDNDRNIGEARAGSRVVLLAQGRMSRLISMQFDSLQVGSWQDTVHTAAGAVECSTHVGYVTQLAPDSVVAVASGLKRISVTLWSPEMPGEINLRAVRGNY